MAIHNHIELDIDIPYYLPNIGIYKFALHLTQVLFSLLVSCLVGSTIAFNYFESSQSNSRFIVVISIWSLCIALILSILPLSKCQVNNYYLKSIRQFFLRPRTDLVFNLFFSLAWIIVSIVVTTEALEQTSCTHEFYNKLIASNSNNNIVNTLVTQCNCIKAGAVFSWLSVITWIITVISSLLLFCHQKQVNHNSLPVYQTKEEDSFPSSPSSYDADAPTIVEMQYSEKDKQPVISYNSFYEPTRETMYIPPPYLPQHDVDQVHIQHETIPNSFASPYSNPYIASSNVQFSSYHKY